MRHNWRRPGPGHDTRSPLAGGRPKIVRHRLRELKLLRELARKCESEDGGGLGPGGCAVRDGLRASARRCYNKSG